MVLPTMDMEGKQVTFFITNQNLERHLLVLSEYDTVEQLKIEIDCKFDIAVAKQEITGWHQTPPSEDTILQVCCQLDNINCLNVTEYIEGEVRDACLPEEEATFTNTTSEIDYTDREIDAIIRLKEKLPENVLSKIRQMSFQDAVSHVCDPSNKRNALLLYLHNSQDVFSQNLLTMINDNEIKNILDADSFLIIGWDIEDQYHHSALVQALQPYPHLSRASHLITDKIGSVLCLFPDNDGVALFSCLRGNISYDSVLECLRNLQQQPFMDESNSTESISLEIEAIRSLKRKLPADTAVTFREFSMEDALNFICTSPFNERKTLLLYLHNSASPFSQMFSQNLANGELARILNRNFLLLGWDVENPEYHDALVSALSRHINLVVVSDLVTNQIAVGLCILPVSGTISVFLCLRGNITLKDTLKSLKEAEVAFNKEIEREIELDKIEREKSNKNDLGSEKLQSIWADMLGDRDYDSFEFDQHQLLKDKIGFALKGPPQDENGYDSKTLKQIDELFQVITTENNKITQLKDHIEISFIYNCLEPLCKEKIKRAKKYPEYNPHTDVNPVPVFVLRKCRGSANPCRVFIDDTGRVYKNWNQYLTKNKLPECEMVVPLDGRYQVINGKVLLERLLSPACQLDTKFLLVGDIVGTAAGLASGAVFVTAAAGIAALPVAPAVLIAAGVFGAGAGVWAIGRSAYTLYDRSAHKESMSFANSEARGAYLNIVAGSLGFVGAGANMALTQLVARGANIGKGATYLVNTVGVLNITAGGASLVNSGYEVIDQWISEDQAPSALTILQLSSSILFFGHAVYNFKGAQTIVDETQARVLKDYQDSLRSNRHRKTFTKLMKETVRTHGDGTRGRAEVISAIRNIQNKDEVFAALTRHNKAMNKAGVRFSANDGQVTLGGIPVDMNEFIGFNKKQTETFLGNLSQEHTSQLPTAANSSNNNNSLNTAIKNVLSDINVDVSAVNINQLITLTTELLVFCSGDIKAKLVGAVHQAIEYMFRKVPRAIADEIDKILPKNSQFLEFLRLGMSFFSRKVDEWEEKYQKFQKTGMQMYYDPLFGKINPVYLKRTVEFFEFVVRNSYSGEALTRAVLKEIFGYATAWITRKIFEYQEKKESERRRERHSAGFRVKKTDCDKCCGYYFHHDS